MMFIGIDPGLSGALALIDSAGGIRAIQDTPTIEIKKARGKKRVHDVGLMVDLIEDLTDSSCDDFRAMIEESQAMPGQGVTSSKVIGEGFGLWLGILAAKRIPYLRVRPNVWKRALGLDKDKEKTRLRAIERWPTAGLHRKKDHNRAEAIFLAEYCRLTADKVKVAT